MGTRTGGRPSTGRCWKRPARSSEDATLLGFVRVASIRGAEEGRVRVRSLWCADVSLDPWEPRHEITARLIVPHDEALERVGFGGDHRPIYERWFRDALTAKGLA